jgi:DNA polymerase IIIc chi subunit
MTESKQYKFYELANDSIEKALPQLIYKIYDKLEQKILLLLKNKEEVELFDRLLWSFSSNKFLPHGTAEEKIEYYTKLLITAELDNKNNAKILVSNLCLDKQIFTQQFSQIIYIFSHKQGFAEEYQRLKTHNIKANYWQQGPDGKWQENG